MLDVTIMDVEELETVDRNVDNGQPEVIDAENGELIEQGKLLPPPTKKFHNREELLEYVQYFSVLQGYAATIRDSKRDQYVTIGCDRGGSYRNRTKTPIEERKRKTSSRLINCPFQIKGVKLVDGSWILRINNGAHNHEASNNISGHPSFHLFSKGEIARIKEMCKSGITPRKILNSLRLEKPNLESHDELIDGGIEKRKDTKKKIYEISLVSNVVPDSSIHNAQSLEFATCPQSSNLTSKNTTLDLNIVRELANAGSGVLPMIDRLCPPRQSQRFQDAVSFSPCEAMEPLIERTTASKDEDEDNRCSSKEKNDNEVGTSKEINDNEVGTNMGARTMEEKIDYAIFLLEEQGKNIKTVVSKETNMYPNCQEIDDLKAENLDLRRKLEIALAELERYKKV